jgi:hypothetical protein
VPNYRPKTRPKISPFWVSNLERSSIWKECSFFSKIAVIEMTVSNQAPRVPLGGENDVPASPAGPEGLHHCRRRTRRSRGDARGCDGRPSGRSRTRSLPQFVALNYSGIALVKGGCMSFRPCDVQCDPIADRALKELAYRYTVAEEKSGLVLTEKTGNMKGTDLPALPLLAQ